MAWRRRLLVALLLFAAPGAAQEYPPADPGYRLRFPADEGSHPAFRGEWWYVTGWLEEVDGGAPLGFQVTFFRFRSLAAEANPSRFAPRQVMVAHAALSDPRRGSLLHDERVARAIFGLAGAAEGRTSAWIDDWRLAADGAAYRAEVAAAGFALGLTLTPTQPPLLHGAAGFSRKTPQPGSASHYYSLPQLEVAGEVTLDGRARAVRGTAWLDHEWFSALAGPRAAGWDWTGLNLADGGAVMAFRMRDRAGGALWTSATVRGADGTRRTYEGAAVSLAPGRRWQSPRTGITYPVAWALRAGPHHYALTPLMDDQELAAQASTGVVYWEGAVTALVDGAPVGRGYLELTGYGDPFDYLGAD